MPQEYQDPIASVIQGLLQGHAIATSIHRQKQQDEAFARHNALQDQESSIQDIMNQMHLEQNARPVMSGTVQDMLPAAPEVPGQPVMEGGNPRIPIVRPVDKSRRVTYKNRAGESRDYELYTPEEQMDREITRGNALQDAKVANETKRTELIRKNQLTLEGGGVPAPEGLQSVGVVPGTRLTRAELVNLTEAAQKIRGGNVQKLGEGDTLVDVSGATPRTIASGTPKPKTAEQQWMTATAAKLGKTVETLTPEETLTGLQEYAQRTKDPETVKLAHAMTQANLEMQRARLDDLRSRNNTTPRPIDPGTREYRIAQDLAYGRLTMGQFRTLTAYSRDTNKKLDIYDKAAELNPGFNPAQFEMGYSLAKNPKVQQQLASMDNVKAGVQDLLKFSDQASRTGITALNKFILPGGIAVGGKKYSNFHAAQIGFADELSGALGFGSATDMSRQMGLDMTNPNLSPEAFRSAVEEVVVPFVERKRKTLLDQMGVYGMPGMNPGAGPAATGEKPPLSSFEAK
jgi:hypothetical protein